MPINQPGTANQGRTTETPAKNLTQLEFMLIKHGLFDETGLVEAERVAASQRLSLISYLNNTITGEKTKLLLQAVAQGLGVPMTNPMLLDIKSMPLNLIGDEVIHQNHVVPLFKRGGKLFVGMADPSNTQVLDLIKFKARTRIEAVAIEPAHLATLINRLDSHRDLTSYGNDDDLDALVADSLRQESATNSSETADGNGDEDEPIIGLVNNVLRQSIQRGASDIHFEPYENEYRVRIRIDGLLILLGGRIPKELTPRITARIKVMAHLDVSEKRVPQDGRIKLNLPNNQSMDFRVSTLPTLFGEKVVLRILDSSVTKVGIDSLGFDPDQKQLFIKAIERPYGMVLVTGPTGSGKTVSLYTALNRLNRIGVNVSTVEDPVEIRLPGVNQVQFDHKKGMTFPVALRAFLRQDPDVIMLGEIRDEETAEIAIKAAQTGHMVLATLHTNNTAETINRLMMMNVAPYNITSAVSLVIAQRLVRKLHTCKRPANLSHAELLAEGFTETEIANGLTIYEPKGCDDCQGGYNGRCGIFEIMSITDEIKEAVLTGGNTLGIARAAAKAGVKTLRESALTKVAAGITSLAEINRVTLD